MECGYDVVLIGRTLAHSPPLPSWPFKAVRIKLLFVKGPFFYFFFNLRLFFRLLFSKADLFFANDLDTLLPNYLVSRLKNKPIIYDSHELFCEVPELQKTPFKKKIWEGLEGLILPKLKYCVTVNDSIANIFTGKYNVPFVVVRNIPAKILLKEYKTRAQLDIPENKKVILLQGAGINVDRGAEELVDAMQYLPDCVLLIIGSGDVWPDLQEKVKILNLNNVILIDRIPRSELVHFTAHADLGISIDKNTNLNYQLSLPNKIFDYLQAGVPLLTSRLPEIEKIVTQYQIGDFITSHDPESIAEKIHELFSSDKLETYKKNTQSAQGDLQWDKEKEKLKSVIQLASGRSDK